MSRRICRLIAYYLLAVLIMALQKVIFVLVHAGIYSGVSAGMMLKAMWAGLPMDMSMAGYLTVVPGLVLTASAWVLPAVADKVLKVWYAVVSVLIALTFGMDLVLYTFWGFKLDSTPVFYFLSSPKMAMASTPWYYPVAGVAGVALYAYTLYRLFALVTQLIPLQPRGHLQHRGRTASVLLVLTGLLFVAIRGGFTVSTMNLSSAYHSADMRMNHAAINPMFSLLYSLTHHSDFGSEARLMPDDRAEDILAEAFPRHTMPDSTVWLSEGVTHPDIYVIILESFSAHLMPSLGGEDVAPGLDSLARNGLSFSRCYAPGFRTDRGIPAILSGYPCPPATSVMKYADVAEKLPGLAKVLAGAGYSSVYYYGGDINFTNQLAYIRGGGFDRVWCDRDWPVSQRLSKWGVHDGPMLARVWEDVSGNPASGPMLRVIQTSSSHEPFEVPRIAAPGVDPRVNAFAYTDSCVTAFVDSLATLDSWPETLVVLTADHYGAYPDRPSDPIARHWVPLVFAGGALARTGQTDSTICSHTDIAPTLARLAGCDPAPFVWGVPLNDSVPTRTAVFAEPDLLGAVTPDGVWYMYPDAPTRDDSSLLEAWLQCNYNYLDRLRKSAVPHRTEP